jgi:preprotein translocase subunit SecE
VNDEHIEKKTKKKKGFRFFRCLRGGRKEGEDVKWTKQKNNKGTTTINNWQLPRQDLL